MTAALPRVSVPDETAWQPSLGAYFHTGTNAVERVAQLAPGTDVASDIETPSVTDSFTIKCVTASWVAGSDTHTVLLDPSRDSEHAGAVRTIADRARWLILHGSPFDMPGLVAAELVTLDQLAKVMDTLIYARSAWPDQLVRKSLEVLAGSVLGMTQLAGALKMAQKASGLTSNDKWYREGDIHIPVYRHGAMADTLVTLRLAHPLFEAAVARQLDHPFARYGCTTREQAAALVLREQQVNRIMLRRACRGLEVDLEYLDTYVDSVQADKARAEIVLRDAGLRPGIGIDVIKKLEADGALPANWPRTKPTKSRPYGTLKSDKETMELLPEDHPLGGAHRTVAHTDKVLGYMEKTVARSRITGRLHPQFNILGASATGRISASEPEIQQFPADARPIIRCDKGSVGMQSVDWSSIEPALMGWLANDWGFITPFENGADIYEPVMKSTGKTRDTSKVVVLADMYGRGITSMALKLGIDTDSAKELKRKMHAAMPVTARFMRRIKDVAEDTGLAITVSGRVLTVPKVNGLYLGYKAVNYTAQGSQSDMLYASILAADEAGISDGIILTMHDEVVCVQEVAEDMQRVMSTPPAELIARCGGRIPTIRVDSQFLGGGWRKC